MTKKRLTSAKRGAICRFFGIDVAVQIDPDNNRRVLFITSQVEAADKAMGIYDGDHALPCRQLMDILTEIHHEVKACLNKHRQTT